MEEIRAELGRMGRVSETVQRDWEKDIPVERIKMQMTGRRCELGLFQAQKDQRVTGRCETRVGRSARFMSWRDV